MRALPLASRRAAEIKLQWLTLAASATWPMLPASVGKFSPPARLRAHENCEITRTSAMLFDLCHDRFPSDSQESHEQLMRYADWK